jgi:phosphatidylglycerophosphatase A
MAWACKILCGGTNQCTLVVFLAALIVVAATGVWSASAVARFTGKEDPQIVVIDEVSGQQITYLLALLLAHLASVAAGASSAQSSADFAVARLLNWKFLLAGFLLFRLFDITKPFPCRRLERLPAGWGIMADDCMAGVYAAILLWAALHFRLL